MRSQVNGLLAAAAAAKATTTMSKKKKKKSKRVFLARLRRPSFCHNGTGQDIKSGEGHTSVGIFIERGILKSSVN